MRPFVVNGHGRLVFPSNFSAELDFSVLETLEQLEAVVKRDFEAKAPTGTEILERVDAGDVRLARAAAARPRDEPGLGQPLRDDDVREAADPVARPSAPSRRRLPAAADAVGAGRAQGGGRRGRRGPSSPATWDAEAEDGIFSEPVRHLPPQAPPRDRAPAREADRGRDHERPGEPHLLSPEPRPGPPDPQLRGDPRLQRVGRRARAAPPPGDGAPQPVPVGPGAVAARGGRQDRRRRLRRRVRAAQPRGARVHPAREGRASRRARGRRRRPRRASRSSRSCPRSCASSSRSCRASSRWRSSRASTSARTRTSSATRPTAGRR